MADVHYDKKDQLEKVQAHVMPGETLYAVLDMKGGGTGFVGITDLRLIFLDHAFVRKSKAMVSIPFSKITAVASVDSGGIIFGTSTLQVVAGSREWEFEFRSNEKAHYAYQLIMRNLLQKEARGMMKD
jgi:hypothetical protein